MEGRELIEALARAPPANTFEFLIYCAAVPPHGLGVKNAQAHLQHLVTCELETCPRCETIFRLFPTKKLPDSGTTSTGGKNDG